MARKNYQLTNLSYNDDRYKSSYLLSSTDDDAKDYDIPDCITDEIVNIFPDDIISVIGGGESQSGISIKLVESED